MIAHAHFLLCTAGLQELCGRSVEDCIRDGQVLYWPDGSPDQAAILRMLIDAARGLDYLAACGIVHGDVKVGVHSCLRLVSCSVAQ
jgi:hypothetical protein